VRRTRKPRREAQVSRHGPGGPSGLEGQGGCSGGAARGGLHGPGRAGQAGRAWGQVGGGEGRTLEERGGGVEDVEGGVEGGRLRGGLGQAVMVVRATRGRSATTSHMGGRRTT
jgi:hypothetical protein